MSDKEITRHSRDADEEEEEEEEREMSKTRKTEKVRLLYTKLIFYISTGYFCREIHFSTMHLPQKETYSNFALMFRSLLWSCLSEYKSRPNCNHGPSSRYSCLMSSSGVI